MIGSAADGADDADDEIVSGSLVHPEPNTLLTQFLNRIASRKIQPACIFAP